MCESQQIFHNIFQSTAQVVFAQFQHIDVARGAVDADSVPVGERHLGLPSVVARPLVARQFVKEGRQRAAFVGFGHTMGIVGFGHTMVMGWVVLRRKARNSKQMKDCGKRKTPTAIVSTFNTKSPNFFDASTFYLAHNRSVLSRVKEVSIRRGS
jgi:hypothetical protein